MNVRQTSNLVYWNSGAGIARDVALVEEILRNEGMQTRHIPSKYFQSNFQRCLVFLRQWPTLVRPVAAQFHFQWIQREQCLHGKQNYMFVNPEFTDSSVFPKIKQHIAVLCKTRIAEKLFTDLPVESHYVGFTSQDRSLSCQKDYGKFLHVAGLSDYKGTDTLVEVWRKNIQWPTLTIIRAAQDREGNIRKTIEPAQNIEVIDKWLTDEKLRQLQNEHGVHLCPSEMEGFGHYIMEGLSTGAVVVATDAAPMNELVNNGCGFLVKAKRIGKSFMSDRWNILPEELEDRINQILNTPSPVLQEMSNAARKKFEEMDKDFRFRFRKFIHTYLLA